MSEWKKIFEIDGFDDGCFLSNRGESVKEALINWNSLPRNEWHILRKGRLRRTSKNNCQPPRENK